jgi:ribosomal protein S18 acetylase RimI-like enzyme
MIIREVRPSDFDDFVSAFFSYFDEVKDDPSFGLALMREKPTMDEERVWFNTVLKDMQEGNVINMVAEVDSHVIGNCVVRRVKPKSPEDYRGNLGIAVKKGFRGQGIGETLMRAAIERSRGRFEVIELAVLSDNRGAKKLYEKFGFRTYGTRRYALKRAGRYFDEDLMMLKL